MKALKGVLWSTAALAILAGIAFWMRPLDFFDDYTYLDDAVHGVQNRWTWVDGYRMHYEVEGPASGRPVVLIHGLGGRAEDWRGLAPYLAEAGYRVYMPDLIGYGRSARPANFSYSISGEAALVVDFFDNMGLKQADLGGWSMGGWIVQVVAYRHPERVKRLMLFDSAGIHEMPAWDTAVFTPKSASQVDQLEALLTPNPPRIPGFVAEDVLRQTRESGWVVARAMNQMLTGRDVTDAMLPKLEMPVLIEWGAEDRIVPLEQAEKMHRLAPHSTLQVYAHCGHLAPLRCAQAMGPNVVRFLNTAQAGPGGQQPEAPQAAQGATAHLDAPRTRAGRD